MDGLRQFPQDFTLQFYFAALIGDYPKCTSTPLKNALIQRSRTLFEKLLKEPGSNQRKYVIHLKMNIAFIMIYFVNNMNVALHVLQIIGVLMNGFL